MKFSSIIGELDIGVLKIDRIEALSSRRTLLSSIYISKKHGFVVGWPAERWYLWELPREGDELLSKPEDEKNQQIPKLPEGVKVPIVISARENWKGVFPSVNLTVHKLKEEKTAEDYIKEATQPMLATGKFRVLTDQSGVTPQNDIGFLTLAAKIKEGMEIFQIQKFVIHQKVAYTLTVMNIVPSMPQGYKIDMAAIVNSFALIGKTQEKSSVWQTIKRSIPWVR